MLADLLFKRSVTKIGILKQLGHQSGCRGEMSFPTWSSRLAEDIKIVEHEANDIFDDFIMMHFGEKPGRRPLKYRCLDRKVSRRKLYVHKKNIHMHAIVLNKYTKIIVSLEAFSSLLWITLSTNFLEYPRSS